MRSLNPILALTINTLTISILLITLQCSSPIKNQEPTEIPSSQVIPSPKQLRYQKMEMVGFIHFTVNTFTDKEWGYGDESPEIFNPTELDTEQWVLSAKAGGLKELILTAKHHDGFCLWPSQYTEHSVKNSPYKDGKGDIVKEFVDACRKHGLKAGLYLSPWDRNHPDYGKPEYITYYRNQLKELLTNYGEVQEIWFDGANGGDGYYGGAREERRVDKETYYDWANTFKIVYDLQPDILIFSDAGPDIRWVGNEHGFAGETFWSTIDTTQLVIGASDSKYLNVGAPDGNDWLIGQCDVSIRPGWFYHASQDTLVKDTDHLLDIYYKSVGRNGVLLLNLPPDQRGLIPEYDAANLKKFKNIIDQTFKHNLAKEGTATASNIRDNHSLYSAQNILDQKTDTYWATDDSIQKAEIIIELPEKTGFNIIMLQEGISFGQRIHQFQISTQKTDNTWEEIAKGTTIGYKRLLRIPDQKTSKIKITLESLENPPVLAEFGLFKADY